MYTRNININITIPTYIIGNPTKITKISMNMYMPIVEKFAANQYDLDFDKNLGLTCIGIMKKIPPKQKNRGESQIGNRLSSFSCCIPKYKPIVSNVAAVIIYDATILNSDRD